MIRYGKDFSRAYKEEFCADLWRGVREQNVHPSRGGHFVRSCEFFIAETA
jgi:hypothetical protein